MSFSEPITGVLLVSSLALSGLLLIVVGWLAVRLSRLTRAYGAALDTERGEDVFQSLQRQAGELDRVRDDLAIVHDNTEHLRDLLGRTVSRVGVVRYDAFADMGGALSFSAAMLDEHGDGVVMSAINGRTETRTYAKPVVGQQSDFSLSDEELAAIDAAMRGTKGEILVPSRKRRGAAAS